MAAVVAACWVGLIGVMAGPVAVASAASSAAAPQQLTNAYPLGPQRLCCNGQTGANGQTRTSAQTGTNPQTGSDRATDSRPTAGVTPAHSRTQPTGDPGHGRSSGGLSAVLLIGLGAAAALLVVGGAAVSRNRRTPLPLPAEESWGLPPAPHLTGTPAAAGHPAGVTQPRGGRFSWDRSPSGASAAPASDEREYRRLDESGDAGGAFNLGVVLHQRGEVAAAVAAYERAEQRGDPDAGFNLGVLLYESGDLDGAEAAWRRAAGRGHLRAAANLVFLSRGRRGLERGGMTPSGTPELSELEELSYRRADESGIASAAYNLGVILHQRGDIPGATAAYERAEQRGDPDAAFNLGVLLYEAGDLDGAEAAWRRDAGRGHSRAAENLEFLQRRWGNEPQRAAVGGEGGD